ncbi:MAG: glycosyltransferase [Deltaproteobacteria bacterium]|nr:glycosyltransferase [Deltaproteobacteria bacterium]
MKIVICGLSITSSWGNGHATTYRALVRELARRGHDVLFLEADRPWYASNRDLPSPSYCETELYETVDELKRRFAGAVRRADAVLVGSYVPEGARLVEWATRVARGVTAFYDIDTPVTMDSLARGDCEYLSPELIPRLDLYLSFTGGPLLRRIERELGSPSALPLYCSVDVDEYHPERSEPRWDLGYLGTYSDDRQPTLGRFLVEPALALRHKSFVVAGAQYPEMRWPANVERIEHLPPHEHRGFYNSQRFTLNVTRSKMIEAGFSPSVRLFEAAACGTPIISDYWDGLDTIFEPGKEILIATSGDDVRAFLELGDRERARIGERARRKVLRDHTAARRAEQLEHYLLGRREETANAKAGRKATGLDRKAWTLVP